MAPAPAGRGTRVRPPPSRHLPADRGPPAGLLPAVCTRTTPYLYSRADITALLAAAAALSPPLRAATYQTLIGLLAVTGMRIGEAIALEGADVGEKRSC